jgi:hypothetical protein
MASKMKLSWQQGKSAALKVISVAWHQSAAWRK